METIIIIVLTIIVLVLSAYFWKGGVPNLYSERACTGKEWKNEFPNSSKEMIREYLECFVDGMAFNSNERLKFKPSDEILKVYQGIYGGKTPFSDVMELETFYLNLTKGFQISREYLEKVWHEHLTLGELFNHIIAQQGTPADPKTAARFLVG